MLICNKIDVQVYKYVEGFSKLDYIRYSKRWTSSSEPFIFKIKFINFKNLGKNLDESIMYATRMKNLTAKDLYSRQHKIDKDVDLSLLSNGHFQNSKTFRHCQFCAAQSVKNFALRYCMIARYIVDYIHTFLDFFKHVNMFFELFKIKSSMQPRMLYTHNLYILVYNKAHPIEKIDVQLHRHTTCRKLQNHDPTI
jgi:hypothetical protein